MCDRGSKNKCERDGKEKAAVKNVVSKAQNEPSVERKFSVTQLLAQAADKKDAKSSHEALVKIRTHVLRLKEGVTLIRQRGGPQTLLNVLEYGDERVIDVCLSILGNCCTDEKFRTEVIQRDGVAIIGTVLQEAKSTSIQNRACRTLANVAMTVDGCRKVHEEDQLLEAIVSILSSTTDRGSQQTFIRIIRLLSDSKPHRIAVLRERGLKVVADLLKSSDDGVMMAALKSVSHYINEHPTEQCALQLDLAETSKFLLTQSKEGEDTVASIAKRLVVAMVKQECFRPGLGNAGSIPYFLEIIKDESLSTNEKYVYINSMCLSCKESLNRVRIRESNGLETLIGALQNPEYEQIHNRIISAFLCFLYDEASFQILLKNGIVKLLMKHLACCLSLTTKHTMPTDYLRDLIDGGLVTLLSDVVIDDEDMTMDTSSVLNMESTSDDTLVNNRVVFSFDCDENVRADDMDTHNVSTEDAVFERSAESREVTERSLNQTDESVPRTTLSNPLQLPGLCGQEDDDDLSQKEDSPKRNLVKYSMDSPTYKQITATNNEYNYDPRGPTNIRDCQDAPGSSPAGYSSPTWSLGSPMSTSSFASESYSPFSCGSSFISPDRSPRSMSPMMDEISTLSPNDGRRLHVSQSCPGQFSPLQGCIYNSPTKSPAYSAFSYSDVPSPASVSSNTERTDAPLEYSSSEEDDTVGDGAGDDLTHVPELTTSGQPEPAKRGGDAKDLCAETVDAAGGEGADSKDGEPELKENAEESDEEMEEIRTGAHLSRPVLSKDVISTTEANILIFISRISFMDNPNKYLTNHIVIEGLMNFLVYRKHSKDGSWSRAHRILSRILKLPTSLEHLIANAVPVIISIAFNNLFAETASTAPPREDVFRDCIEVMSLTAQNRYGLGVMKHSLMTGAIKSSMKAFLCVPLLYSDSKEVKSLLRYVPQGIDIIMHCLASDSDILVTSAVVFLCHLNSVCLGHHSYSDWYKDCNQTLDVHLPRKRKRSASQEDVDIPATSTSTTGDSPAESGDLDVKFILSDGSQLKASRTVMISSSSVFSAMLEGSFSESGQSVIEIADVDRVSFRLFVDYLHTSCSRRRDFLKGTKLEPLLAVLFLAERYMVHQLHRDASLLLEAELKTKQLFQADCDVNDPAVVSLIKVFQTTLLHNCYYITERVLAVLLDAQLSLSFRHNVMKKCLYDDTLHVDKVMVTSLRSMLSIIVEK